MNADHTNRYSRQEAFYGIGKEGQEKIAQSRVTVIGLGALGSVSADHLARAGVGYLRIVDRDYVELSNLQRQVLYTEEDAEQALPKAIAAARHLGAANSDIVIDPVVTDVNSSSIDSLIEDVDLVVDATDNFEVRFLLNEACHHLKKDWIYGGALGSTGMTMNYPYSEDGPCFSCITRAEKEAGANGPTCVTAGVLSMTTAIVSSVQCAEALKMLTGAPDVRKTLLYFDLWANQFEEITVSKDPDCPVCVHEQYTYYGKSAGMTAVSLCGRNQVQVIPEHTGDMDFGKLAGKLSSLGTVSYNDYTLDFDKGDIGFKLFKNGRAIIKNIDDESRAKSIYTEYIG